MLIAVVIVGITSPTKAPSYHVRVDNLPISVTQSQAALQLQQPLIAAQSQHLVPVSMLDQGGRPILIGANNASLPSPWQQAHRPSLVLGSWQPTQAAAAAALASLPPAPAHQRAQRVGDARGFNDAWARPLIVETNGLESAVLPIVSASLFTNSNANLFLTCTCVVLVCVGRARVRASDRTQLGEPLVTPRADQPAVTLLLEPAARQPAENGRPCSATRGSCICADDGCRPPTADAQRRTGAAAAAVESHCGTRYPASQ